LLFHLFYALPKSLDSSQNDSDLLTLLDDETLWGFGFLHFYGDMKPWADGDTEKLPSRVKIARDCWLKRFEAAAKDRKTYLEHESPLTSKGIEQYRRAQTLYPEDPGSPPEPTSSPSSKANKANKAAKALQNSS
jgi:hypothetical protein